MPIWNFKHKMRAQIRRRTSPFASSTVSFTRRSLSSATRALKSPLLPTYVPHHVKATHIPTDLLSLKFINYVDETRANTGSDTAARFLAGAQAAFAIGRFAGVGIMKFVRPRWVFLAYMSM